MGQELALAPPRPAASGLMPPAGISRVAQLTGLTPRAIRYYEARGLIVSARDRHNRRRYDAITQAELMFLARLRSAGLGLNIGMALAEIRNPDGQSSAQLVEALRRRRNSLLDRMRVVDAFIDSLSSPGSDR
jgi:DNA-binding transcriptional MerR regulator